MTGLVLREQDTRHYPPVDIAVHLANPKIAL
jgi:hypothetical protein